jgi:hypothetical protein
MIKDEIISEVWRNRDAYVKKHHHNLDKIVRDLQERQKKTNMQVVDRPNRRTKRETKGNDLK